MQPEALLTLGLGLCAAAVLGAVVAAVLLRLGRKRLERRLDADYGKRRH